MARPTQNQNPWFDAVNAYFDGLEAADAANAALAASKVATVAGNPPDAAGDVGLSLSTLNDVSVAAVETDDDGSAIPGTGPGALDFFGWDPTTSEWVNKPITGFAAEGYARPYTLFGHILEVGASLPPDVPDPAVVIDKNRPSRPLIEQVNVVASSGVAVTLPSVLDYQISDVTLTGACTVTLPTAVQGTRFTLLLRQDGTGSRVVTWAGPAIAWNSLTNTAPTLTTTAGKADMLEFLCIGGMGWRQVGTMVSGSGTPTAGATPTVRGVLGANAASSNSLTSVSTTLPAGLATGDILYLLVTVNGTTLTMSSRPTINAVDIGAPALIDGPIQAGSMTTWLFRKSLTSGMSSQAITSGVMSAGGRPCVTGIVLAGADTSGEVLVNNQDTVADTSVDVPAITPTVANSLLVHMSAVRAAIQPTGTPVAENITPPAGWTQQKEHYEGRLDNTNVNFGGFVETKALSGNANVPQGGTTATTPATAPVTERSYVIAVSPPVA